MEVKVPHVPSTCTKVESGSAYSIASGTQPVPLKSNVSLEDDHLLGYRFFTNKPSQCRS